MRIRNCETEDCKPKVEIFSGMETNMAQTDTDTLSTYAQIYMAAEYSHEYGSRSAYTEYTAVNFLREPVYSTTQKTTCSLFQHTAHNVTRIQKNGSTKLL